MEACRSAILEAAKTHLFNTATWGPFCDVSLTLRQARQFDDGAWIRIDEHQCKRAFQHFMNLLNRAVHKNAFDRHGKRLRVLPVLEKGEVRSRGLRSSERGNTGRWHIHCAIEMPSHLDVTSFKQLICNCWTKVRWAYDRALVRDGTDHGWIGYMLKPWQKSGFDNILDCIILESLHNPIADA
jgi:hypothetical protein